MDRSDDMLQRAEADRREVDLTIEAETATWSTCGQTGQRGPCSIRMNALEVGQYLIDVGTFHLHRGRSGCGAYRLQSRSRGIFAFEDHDIQRRAGHVRHPETGDDPGACRARGRTFAWTCCPLVLI